MQEYVLQAYDYAKKWLGEGKVASYIPQLACANSSNLAITVTTLNGEVYSAGKSEVKFTIQSISKVILLATALNDAGFDKVFEKVGMEPTGDPFNSIVRLETMMKKPFNPMINAGAIAITTCITGQNKEERFEKILSTARILFDDENITYDKDVFQSEKQTGSKNRSLAFMMKSNGVFDGDVEEHLDVYFKTCSILANCKQISFLGAVLANGGICPKTKRQLLPPLIVKVICSLMTTCGMYDASGEYAIRVGIPSKSGVGGGIMAASIGKMGIGTFSPALDSKGNSFCGIKAMEYLSLKLGLSIF